MNIIEMDVIEQAREISPELARYIASIAEQPFEFEGEHPLQHSAHNHRHLWMIEWWASREERVDLEFRVRAVEHIFARWRARLRGFAPYQGRGFRLYLYEDMAPSISVVGETQYGCPFGDRFVDHIRDVLEVYVDRDWMKQFRFGGSDPAEAVLESIEVHKGSIGEPTARALGCKVGELRRIIENMRITDEVNAVRKRYKRRPARFRGELEMAKASLQNTRIYEERLPGRAADKV